MTMGAFKGEEVCELIVLFMLHEIVEVEKIFEKVEIGLYRDDGLGATEGSGPVIERKKKDMDKLFKRYGLNITIEANTRRVCFLDVIMDLDKKDFRPFHKKNSSINYVKKGSNHPPQVLRNLPSGVNKRLISRSANKECFNTEKQPYQEAIYNAGFNFDLHWEEKESEANTVGDSNVDSTHTEQRKRQRRRKVIWFNPPYSDYVATQVGRIFRQLIDCHFKKGTLLGKLFNHNTLKVSYSCVPNLKAKVTSHNRKILSKPERSVVRTESNCRVKEKCPFKGERACDIGSAVYKAVVKTGDPRKEKFYIGSSNNFKKRCYSHKDTFIDRERMTESCLSEYVWKLKDEGEVPEVTWSIISRDKEYTRESKKCNLCIREKLEILKNSLDVKCLNQRSEIMNKCRHRNKFLLSNMRWSSQRMRDQNERFEPGEQSGGDTRREAGLGRQMRGDRGDPGQGGPQRIGQPEQQGGQSRGDAGTTRSGRRYNLQIH